MKVVVTVIGYKGWYPRGVARLIQRFHVTNPQVEVQAWVNVLPPGSPINVVEEKWDYTGYCAKPFALLHAMENSDIAILMDAAFWPIAPMHSFVEYIRNVGYYFCRNGFNVGQWCSDRALEQMEEDRETLMNVEEVSSYCVGVSSGNPQVVDLVNEWCFYAADRTTFPGPHTNINFSGRNPSGRNKGFVSHDPRVMGHRHDQTALSVIAWRFGMRKLVSRPRFTSYDGQPQSDETVLLNRGM